jgi:hypothetical protein
MIHCVLSIIFFRKLDSSAIHARLNSSKAGITCSTTGASVVAAGTML